MHAMCISPLHTLCSVSFTHTSHGEMRVRRWLRGNTLASLITLKHWTGATAPYVLLHERKDGEELWVRYQDLGWKMYSRGAGGCELGWESSMENGSLGGSPNL
jgi:hypothetical protein